MLFNSLQYALFFPAVVVLYFGAPHRVRWLVLLAASLAFYAAGRADHLLVLLASAGIAWGGALAIERAGTPTLKRRLLAFTLGGELLLLFAFKYTAFAARTLNDVFTAAGAEARLDVPKLALPIGISFFTFQGSSYLIDVYRGTRATKSPLRFLLFKSFFPQLVAGPIERVRNLMPQLSQEAVVDYDRMTHGLQLIAWGLFKKMVIADRLSLYVDPVYAHPERYAGAPLYVASFLFTYQIYCDFSGYSDVAIGSAEVLGVRLQENFRRPFHAASIADFWRRWHMSLMSWFFDYLYVPLVNGRRDPWVRRRALFIVFLLSGVWHGASWTFIVWGLLQGVWVVGGEVTRPLRDRVRRAIGVPEEALRLAIFRRVVTFHLVMLSFVFFRASSLSAAAAVLTRMPRLFEPSSEPLLAPGELEIMFGSIVVLELVQALEVRGDVWRWLRARPAPLRWALYLGLVGTVLVFGRFEENTFLYFNF